MDLSEGDLDQLRALGISESMLEHQLHFFERGFDALKLDRPCTIGDGILQLNEAEESDYIRQFESYGGSFAKFTPASGAASRMFKPLFEFLNGEKEILTEESNSFVFTFFKQLEHFAFYDTLKEHFEEEYGYALTEAHLKGEYKKILNVLLGEQGMNYGQLPKGLIEFHRYDHGSKTPVQEQATEAKLIFENFTSLHLHFTISGPYQERINALLKDTPFQVSFSEQKSSTDTVAVDLNNEIVRDESGRMLFRPAGHGALLENLNALDEDIVFIKNIDNVQPDNQKLSTVKYKKLLGGVLIHYQSRIFELLRAADAGTDVLSEARALLGELGVTGLADNEVVAKLNRPIRVCGMVRNVGDPGGGPFWVSESDGTATLQIIESAQVDSNDPQQQEIFGSSTHFNPVDLVCGLKDYKGNSFDLLQFRDDTAGFISEKSFAGNVLKAMELPGLWNGAMSDWNTLFVEVPYETFSPAKTVNDLLKPTHQVN